MIDSDNLDIQHFSRDEANQIWIYQTYIDRAAEIYLKSVDARLRLADIDERIGFPAPPDEEEIYRSRARPATCESL